MTVIFLVFSDCSFCGRKCKVTPCATITEGKAGWISSSCAYQHSLCVGGGGGGLSTVQPFGRPAVVETHALWYFGHHCCLAGGSDVRYSIFGCSPCFTHFYLFAQICCSFPSHPLFFYVNFSPPWGSVEPPRMQGLCSTCALFWAPEKGGVRQPLLILSLLLGTPENAGVM